MSEHHYGNNGMAACGTSRLLVGATTDDLQAVDCRKCLWLLMAKQMEAAEIIMMRIKIVTDAAALEVL